MGRGFEKGRRDVGAMVNFTKRREIGDFNQGVLGDRKKIAFGDAQWFGQVTSYSPTQIPPGNGILCLNASPQGTYLESPLGYTFVGTHLKGQLALEQYEGLIAGEICQQGEQGANDNIDKNIFKIVRKKFPNADGVFETAFFVLGVDGNWRDFTPYADTYIDGELNPEPKIRYNFRGEKFDYVVWKNILYICSGEEWFEGSNGSSGLMRFDGQTWDSILTGKAGFPSNQPEFKNKSALDGDENYPPDFRLYDSTNEFNPSLLCLFQERLFISGAESNPLQVKMSEWNNPDNFVDNVLGMQTAPLTSKDTARASSFVVTSGCDKITSLTSFNNEIYVGTDKKVFIYNLNRQTIGENVVFQLESIIQNDYTPAGTVNQYSTVAFQNRLYFLSNYQVVPEFSAFTLSAAPGASKPYSSYEKLSGEIDSLMEKLDISEACIGVYGGSVLIGVNYNDPDGRNNMTIVSAPYLVNNNQVKWAFYILDYIKPTYFYQNNRGCYFTNKEDGELYKITPNRYGVEFRDSEGYGEVTYPISTWQSGWTGYNPLKDSSISRKVLDKFVVKGYFSEGTIITISMITEDTCDQKDQTPCFKTTSFEFECVKPDKVGCDKTLTEELTRDMRYREKAPYYTLNFDIPTSENKVTYTSLSYRIHLDNCRYFSIESVTGVSTQQSPDGVTPIAPEFVDVQEC